MPGINVNILIHGLFFMTQEVNNLRIYAPNIKDHHFIGGMRGTRQELSGLYDFSGWGLRGKADPQTGRPVPAPDTDVDGSIMQFSPSDVGPLKPPGDSTFLGSILLPWPLQVIGLRTGDITKTPGPDPTTHIGKKIWTMPGRRAVPLSEWWPCSDTPCRRYPKQEGYLNLTFTITYNRAKSTQLEK